MSNTVGKMAFCVDNDICRLLNVLCHHAQRVYIQYSQNQEKVTQVLCKKLIALLFVFDLNKYY